MIGEGNIFYCGGKKTGFFWRTKVFDLRRTETACLNETFQKTVSLPFQLSSSDPLHE